MPITATTIGVDATLEQLRQEYNNLQSDVTTLQDGPTFGASIEFEGATADAYETTLAVVDATADRTITLPNSTGTVLLDVAAAMSDAAGPAMLNEAATATNPTLIPDRAELDTGIGWASDTIHFVGGGVSEAQIGVAGTTFNNGENDRDFRVGGNSAGDLVDPTYALHHDAALGTFGIGIAAAANKPLQWYIDSDTAQIFRFDNTGNTYAVFEWNTDRNGDAALLHRTQWQGTDSGNAETAYARMDIYTVLDNAGAETGKIDFCASVAATNTKILEVTGAVGDVGINVDGIIRATNAAGPAMLDEAATSTNPTVLPNRADVDTGIGWLTADQGTLVAGATAMAYWGAGVSIRSTNAAGPGLVNEAINTTNPGLIPNQAEYDTGIGWASDTIHMIGGGISEAQIGVGGTIFNEGSNDRDFRVETTDSAYALFVDGGNDSVSIGVNNVTPTVTANQPFAIFADDATQQTVKWDNDSTGLWALQVNNDDNTTGQKIFRIGTDALDAANNATNYNQLDFSIGNATSGSESGKFVFGSWVQGAGEREVAVFNGDTGWVFNESSDNIDFRVESNNNANMLHIDAGYDSIGFGRAGLSTAHYAFGRSKAYTGAVDGDEHIMFISANSNAVTTAGSGTHGFMSTLILNEPNITIGTAAVTSAATFIINQAPTEATNNYAMIVQEGASRFDGTVHAENAAGWGLLNEAATSTNPTVLPNRAEVDTGLGWVSDTIHFVGGGISEAQIGVAGTIFNEGSNDRDFRVETNNQASMLVIDGGTDIMAFGGNVSTNNFLKIQKPKAKTMSVDANDFAIEINMDAYATTTAGSGTNASVATMYIGEPNLTIGTASITTAATVWIAGAPSEATNNYALLVDAGTARFDGAITTGDASLDGNTTLNDSGADKDFRVETNNQASMLVIDGGTDSMAIGGAVSGVAQFRVTGSWTPTSSPGANCLIDGTMNPPAGQYARGGLQCNPTIVEAGSGTHGYLAGAWFNMAVTNGSATTTTASTVQITGFTAAAGTTNAASLYIDGPPASATNNYALWVDSGNARLDGDIHFGTSDVGTLAFNGGATMGDNVSANYQFQFRLNDSTDGGGWQWNLGASNWSALRLKQTGDGVGETIFNEDGIDRDHRIETDASPYAFFLDAGTDTLNLGFNAVTPTATANRPFQIACDDDTEQHVRFDNAGIGLWDMSFYTDKKQPGAAIWQTQMWGHNDADQEVQYGLHFLYVNDETDGTEDASWIWNTMVAGTSTNRMVLGGGMYMTGATGGDKGAGTVNATAIYDDNSQLTDYVLEDYVGINREISDIEYMLDPTGERRNIFKSRNGDDFNIDWYSNFWKKNSHLPAFPHRDEWLADNGNGRPSVGAMTQRLLETVEVQATHIDQLNTKNKELEDRINKLETLMG